MAKSCVNLFETVNIAFNFRPWVTQNRPVHSYHGFALHNAPHVIRKAEASKLK
jgi:hypothetical protein